MSETENQIRLRRAKESLTHAREVEAATRKQLIDDEGYTKRAKERYDELFMAEEMAEAARRKADSRLSSK